MLNTSVRIARGHAFRPPMSPSFLRAWLRGRWAVLFSHPHDFASSGFEADRWVECVREAFDGTAVRAIGIRADDDWNEARWIREVGGCFIRPQTLHLLARGQRTAAQEIDLSACLDSATHRFVTILDGSLRPRRTLVYQTPDQAPSPIGLAAIAASRRERAEVGELQAAGGSLR